MKTTTEIWYELYDLGINQGLGILNEKQLCLYNYIDLLYSLEMGGITSFLYNSIGDNDKFEKYITTLKYFGLHDITEILIQFSYVFKKTDDGRDENWEDFLDRTGIADDVENLDDKILSIVTVEKVDDWITINYNELVINLE